jgi:hypothetical protein
MESFQRPLTIMPRHATMDRNFDLMPMTEADLEVLTGFGQPDYSRNTPMLPGEILA